MKTRCLLSTLMMLMINITSWSQANNSGQTGQETFIMFRDPSYITFAGGIGNIDNLVFEADIIPYYLLSLSISDRWGIELSPRVILRMYNQDSFPVRTPSFIPKVTTFYQFKQSTRTQDDLFGYFSWCHHSNGQDDSFYMPDSLSINIITGNFATNYIETGLYASHPDKMLPETIKYFKLSIQYHYYHIEEIDGLYGDLRFFVDHQSTININRVLRRIGIASNELPQKSTKLTIQLKTGYIAGNMNNYHAIDYRRLIIQPTVSYKPAFLQDVTLFAQYYYGQDYYNIYFNRQLHVLRFGISAKQELFGK